MTDPRFQLDGRTHRERMLAGDFYLPEDHELTAERRRAAMLVAAYNRQGEARQEADTFLVNRWSWRCSLQ